MMLVDEGHTNEYTYERGYQFVGTRMGIDQILLSVMTMTIKASSIISI
jgi:hypothetical protein